MNIHVHLRYGRPGWEKPWIFLKILKIYNGKQEQFRIDRNLKVSRRIANGTYISIGPFATGIELTTAIQGWRKLWKKNCSWEEKKMLQWGWWKYFRKIYWKYFWGYLLILVMKDELEVNNETVMKFEKYEYEIRGFLPNVENYWRTKFHSRGCNLSWKRTTLWNR